MSMPLGSTSATSRQHTAPNEYVEQRIGSGIALRHSSSSPPYRATHGTVVHAKVRGNLCQRIATARIGRCHGVFGIASVIRIIGERFRVKTALRPGDLL